MTATAPDAALLTVTIGSQELTGWESYSYHAGMDVMPWQITVRATLHQPTGNSLNLQEGMTASVKLGNDLLLTGYLVTISENISARSHSLSLLIASKTLDLTDCSGSLVTSDLNIGNNESSGRSLVSMMQLVCKPFSVDVTADDGLDNPTIPFFAINLTETPYAIIDRLCRQVGVIFTDTPEGNVRLVKVGSTQPATALAYGDTIEDYSEQRSTDGRYSVIKAVLQTSQLLSQEPDSADYVSQVKASEAGKEAHDPGITRNRPLLIPVDLGDANFDVAARRVIWEVARRSGRASPITVTVSGHRDASQSLYRPNQPVTLTKPDGSTAERVIASVNLIGGLSGRRASLTLLTADSLQPQPIVNKLAQKGGVAAQTDSSRG